MNERSDPAKPEEETLLLTVFLKTDQSKNLDQIKSILDERSWWERFPPPGIEVVSWYVVMGFGQIVTLRLPPRLINLLNIEIERYAWGVFTTEFFPAYDWEPIRERLTGELRERKAKGETS